LVVAGWVDTWVQASKSKSYQQEGRRGMYATKTTHLLCSLLLLKHFFFLSYNLGLIFEAESKW